MSQSKKLSECAYCEKEINLETDAKTFCHECNKDFCCSMHSTCFTAYHRANNLFEGHAAYSILCLNGKLIWCLKMPKEKRDYFGATLILTGPVICNDGKKFEDYTWEEHLKMAGFFVESEEKDGEEN